MHYSEETIMRLLGGLKWRKKENIRNEGGAQKKESQKTKQNLVFEPVSRFNFFIVRYVRLVHFSCQKRLNQINNTK